MARKKKPETESTDSVSNPESEPQDGTVEVVPTPTLAELEENVKSAFLDLNRSAWAWAVAITKIHDSKLYPGADQPNGWAAYMQARWGIGRAQAFNYVRWVHDEIQLLVALEPLQLEDENGKSTKSRLDSNEQEPPTQPKHRSESKSRAARSSRKRVAGKLNEQDAQELEGVGNMVKVGDQYYAKGTPEFKAEMERLASVKKQAELARLEELSKRPKGGEFLVRHYGCAPWWRVSVADGASHEQSVPAHHRFSREDQAQRYADKMNAKPQFRDEPPKSWIAPGANGEEQEDETDLETQLKDVVVKAIEFYGEKRTATILADVFRKHKEEHQSPKDPAKATEQEKANELFEALSGNR